MHCTQRFLSFRTRAGCIIYGPCELPPWGWSNGYSEVVEIWSKLHCKNLIMSDVRQQSQIHRVPSLLAPGMAAAACYVWNRGGVKAAGSSVFCSDPWGTCENSSPARLQGRDSPFGLWELQEHGENKQLSARDPIPVNTVKPRKSNRSLPEHCKALQSHQEDSAGFNAAAQRRTLLKTQISPFTVGLGTPCPL